LSPCRSCRRPRRCTNVLVVVIDVVSTMLSLSSSQSSSSLSLRLTTHVVVVTGLVTKARPCRAHPGRISAESAAQQRLEPTDRRRAGCLAEKAMKDGQHVGPVAGRDLEQRRVRETGAGRPHSDFIRQDFAFPLPAPCRAQVQLHNTTINNISTSVVVTSAKADVMSVTVSVIQSVIPCAGLLQK